MMPYNDGFVLCVLHNGNPVREVNRAVTIPYHSEYKIRLKNKHSLRAKARVWIDGRKVNNLGDFILKPHETLDLERFLDNSLDSGNRFKFVPLSDSRVNDPTDHNNGIIKVEFYKEQQINIAPIYYSYIPPVKPNKFKETYDWDEYNISYTNNTSQPTGTVGGGCRTTSAFCSTPITSNGLPGATVEGGFSGQRFVYGESFQTEVFPVTLQLKLQAPRSEPVTIVPNKPRRPRYCSGCGKSRRRRTDKFCSNCGTRYKRKTV